MSKKRACRSLVPFEIKNVMTYVFDIEDPVVYVCGAGWFNSRYDVQQIERIVPLRVSDRHVDDFRQGLLANVTTGQAKQIWSTTI